MAFFVSSKGWIACVQGLVYK